MKCDAFHIIIHRGSGRRFGNLEKCSNATQKDFLLSVYLFIYYIFLVSQGERLRTHH